MNVYFTDADAAPADLRFVVAPAVADRLSPARRTARASVAGTPAA